MKCVFDNATGKFLFEGNVTDEVTQFAMVYEDLKDAPVDHYYEFRTCELKPIDEAWHQRYMVKPGTPAENAETVSLDEAAKRDPAITAALQAQAESDRKVEAAKAAAADPANAPKVDPAPPADAKAPAAPQPDPSKSVS